METKEMFLNCSLYFIIIIIISSILFVCTISIIIDEHWAAWEISTLILFKVWFSHNNFTTLNYKFYNSIVNCIYFCHQSYKLTLKVWSFECKHTKAVTKKHKLLDSKIVALVVLWCNWNFEHKHRSIIIGNCETNMNRTTEIINPSSYCFCLLYFVIHLENCCFLFSSVIWNHLRALLKSKQMQYQNNFQHYWFFIVDVLIALISLILNVFL